MCMRHHTHPADGPGVTHIRDLQIIFVVIMGGVLIAAIEFIMMWFRVGDRSEGAALCSDLFDGTMQFSAILVFIIAIVGSAWERQAQR
eukprot:scaffold66597_cov33-Tisochrysis_lutea.AAC.3